MKKAFQLFSILFGESAIIGNPGKSESACALACCIETLKNQTIPATSCQQYNYLPVTVHD
ncbi:MAG: hypothetical protein K2L84_02935 [Muribaculaceae bacterium]|nr:hypothetical protein [Muribaculaceae bacterium]